MSNMITKDNIDEFRCKKCKSSMTYIRQKDKKRKCRRCGHEETL